MTYEVPDVTVRQIFTTQTPGLSAPALTLCLIGICNQIEKKAIAGTYNRGTQTVVSYPNIIQGAAVDTGAVQVFLQNDFGLFDITPDLGAGITTADITIPANIDLERTLTTVDSTTGSSTGILLEDLTQDFLSLGVTTDGTSKVIVKSPSGNVGTYIVDEIINAQTLRIHEEVSGILDAAPDSVTPKVGVFTGAYTSGIISQTDIGVNAHVKAKTNLTADHAIGTTLINQVGIGSGVKAGDFIRVTHTTVAPEYSGRAITKITANNGLGIGELDLTLALPADVEAGDVLTLSGTTGGLNDGIKTIAAVNVIPTAWNLLAIQALTANNGGGKGVITLTSVPAGIVAGDLVTVANATNVLNNGTKIVDSVVGATILTTTVFSASQAGIAGTASVANVSLVQIVGTFAADQAAPGGVTSIKDIETGGDGDASAAGDYRITAVIGNDSVEIEQPGLLGMVDGTDIVAEGVTATAVVANYLGTGRGRITLPSYTVPVTILSGDKLILNGDTATVSNDGVYDIYAIAVIGGNTVIDVTTVFQTSVSDTTGLVDLQDVNSIRVDTFKIDRVFVAADSIAKTSGDYFRVLSGAALGLYEIIGIYPNKVVLRTGLQTTLNGATVNGDTYNVLRGIPVNSTNNTYSVLKIESGTYSASILVTYTARRRDLTEQLTRIINIDDALTQLGKAIPENPLGLAASLALQNTNNIIYALGIDEDSVLEHQRALSFLESEEVYCLVPLTQDDANIELYPTHCTIMSEEKEKKERICFLNRKLFVQKQVIPLNYLTNYSTAGATDATGTIFTDATNGIFQTAAVAQGDDLEFLDAGGNVTSTYRILSIQSETQLTLLAAYTPSLTGLKYRINSHPLTKLEQAIYIRDYAKSILNRRAFLMWPDMIDVTYANVLHGDGENITTVVPGFYQCACIGGMVVEQLPQQPFTNVPINGIAQLYHSNKYFRPSMLDVMAEGGVYIIIQEIPESIPYTRHQLSTDMTTIEFRELSICKDVDYIAKYFRNNLRPYIGRFNITPEYLNQVRTVAQAILRDLSRNGQTMPGTVIKQLIQDPDRPDSVILDLTIKVPYPANYIRVTLYI